MNIKEVENIVRYISKFMVKESNTYKLPLSEVEKYYENTSMSQTLLKKLKVSLYAYKKALEYKTSSAMILGSIVDALMTAPSEDVLNEYCVFDGEYIPDIDILRKMKHTFKNKKFDDIGYDNILSFIRENKVFPSLWKDSTVYGKFEMMYRDAWDSCVDSGRIRIPVTRDMFNRAVSMADIARSKNRWKELNDSYMVIYQLPVYLKYKGYRYKGLLDMVNIQQVDNKYRIHVIDIKTTNGDILDFPRVFNKLNYGFQAKFYTFLLSEKFNIPVEDILFSFYVVTDYTACEFIYHENRDFDDVEDAINKHIWYESTGYKEDFLVAHSGHRLLADMGDTMSF